MNEVCATGSFSLSNGDPLGGIHLRIDNGFIVLKQVDNNAAKYYFELVGSDYFLKIQHDFSEIDDDDLKRVVIELLETIQFSLTIQYGVGIRIIINSIKRADGRIFRPQNDNTNDLKFDIPGQDSFNLIGQCYPLRSAVRDFNNGLLDRENCPLLFYRAIETLAKMYVDAIESKDGLSANDWGYVHERLNTSSEEIEPLLETNKKHRHGHRFSFEKEGHMQFMSITRKFIYKVMKDIQLNPKTRGNVDILTSF